MKKLLTVVVFMIAAHAAIAVTSAQLLQQKLNGLRSMSANFSQVIRAKQRVISRSSGAMALLRPGKFRWDTKTPMQQLVIADGERIWVYDKDLDQVSVKKQTKGLGGTAALFLSGYNDRLMRDFAVTQSQHANHDVFDLRAESSRDNFQRITLDFQGQVLTAIELYDQLGQHTTVQLSHIKTNLPLSQRLFSFKPPKGVDTIQQ